MTFLIGHHMEKANVQRLGIAVRVALVLGALCAFSLSSHAAYHDRVWWNVDTSGGARYSASQNPTAGASATSSTPSGAGTPANGLAVSHANNQWPVGKASTRLPRGGPTTFDVQGRFVPDSAARALGNLGKSLLRNVAVPVGIGLSLYNFYQDLGFAVSDPDGDGELTVQRKDPSVCTTAPCYQYYANGVSGAPPSGWGFSTPMAACQKAASNYVNPGFTATATSATETVCSVSLCYGGSCSGLTSAISKQSVAPSQPAYTPSSMIELQDAIAQKAGWPTSSSISPLVAEAIKRGERIDMETPTVTGPATSQGPKEVKNKPDGSVVTTNTVNNYNYNQNKVTVTTTTTVTTFNPSTGTTDTETTDTEPEPPKDECAEKPDSVVCAEFDEPKEEIPKRTEYLTFEAVNLFGNGSCPANSTAYLTTTGETITVWDWQKTCELSLPIRALVMSLAAFAAALIVMPVRVQV